MGEYEDAVSRLREEGLDELAETFDKFSASQLRQKASKVEVLEREVEERDKRIRSLESAPKITEAFQGAGVDFDQLRPAELEALRAIEVGEDGEVAEDVVKDAITRLALPIKEGDETQNAEGEQPGAEGVVEAATQAPRNAGGLPQITPADVSGWSVDKWAVFSKEHPRAAESLKRGETVQGIALPY